MNAEQLLMVLPTVAPGIADLTIHQRAAVLEEFVALGGRELLLGGTEPLGFPGFWALARKAARLGVPRVTACLTGSLLEPWVVRELVENGIHMLLPLEGLQAETHDRLHGFGSHGRVMAAVEAFLRQGLAGRVGVLATATRLNRHDLPVVAGWAAGRGLSRCLWTTMPQGVWPSAQLQELQLPAEEKRAVAMEMGRARRDGDGQTYVGPLDLEDDGTLPAGFSRWLRVEPRGEVCRGFAGEAGFVGNLRSGSLSRLLNGAARAEGA